MAIKVGDKAPDFNLPDTDRKERSLKEFLGGNLVLAFYPGAFTSVCTHELCTFRDSLGRLHDLKAHIAAVSVDSPFANKGFADANRYNFPLLSDTSRAVAEQYAGVYEDFGGIKGYAAAKRAVFVIDAKGIVRYAWISEDPGREPDFDAITKALAQRK